MIREESLNLAELLVSSEERLGLNKLPGHLEALADASVDSFPNNNLIEAKQTALAVTREETNIHTELMDEASTKLANIVSNALNDIKLLSGGLIDKVLKEIGAGLNEGLELTHLDDRLTLSFELLDSDVYNSRFFPNLEDITNRLIDYNSPIRVPHVKKIKLDWLDERSVLDYIGDESGELEVLLADGDAHVDFAEYVKHSLDSNEDVVNFSVVKDVDLYKAFALYLLLTKLSVSEEVPEFVKNVSYKEYKEFLIVMRDGMITYLNQLRVRANRLTGLGIRLVPDGIKLEEDKNLNSNVVTGNAKVSYSKEAITLLHHKDISLRDVVKGYYYDTVYYGNAGSPHHILERPEDFIKSYRSYLSDVKLKAREKFVKNLEIPIRKAVLAYVTENEIIKDRLSSILERDQIDAIRWYESTLGNAAIVYAREIHKAFMEKEYDLVIKDMYATSIFITSFMKALGSDVATDLLVKTFAELSTEDSNADKKERLSIAVINTLTELAVKV